MSKVQFTYKTGRQKMIRKRDADLLARLGKGAYQTRVMQPESFSIEMPDGRVLNQSNAKVGRDGDNLSVSTVDIDSMSLDDLHELAKERGIKVHHKAGADKVRAALRGEAE